MTGVQTCALPIWVREKEWRSALGHVQGNVVASGRVELRAGCSVQGDIRALRLAVEDNAVFRGKVDLTQGAAKGPEGAIAPPTGGIF